LNKDGIRKYSKQDIEIARINAGERRHTASLDAIKLLLCCGGWVVSVYLIMNGIVQISSCSPNTIDALSRVIHEFSIDRIGLAIWGAASTIAWNYERIGKKRKTVEIGEMRHRLEAQDAYYSSSGLTRRGETAPADVKKGNA